MKKSTKGEISSTVLSNIRDLSISLTFCGYMYSMGVSRS